MTRPLTPRAADPTCMTTGHRCRRIKQCWLHEKPAVTGQEYADLPGGDDCAHFIAMDALAVAA